MREVRVILVHDYNDYDDTRSILKEGISHWEQISDEDFKFLKANWWRLTSDPNLVEGRLVLIEKDPVPLTTRIDSIKQWIDQERARAEQLQEQKRAQAEARARKKLLRNAESERKLLEELRKKYPDA